MPFGFLWIQNEHKCIYRAIKTADCNDTLMFAAASNAGGNGGIASPASSDRVICICATDAAGNKATFNPSPQPGKLMLSTLGVNIPSLGRGGKKEIQDGTSFAVPIAVGIAASFMEYVRQHAKEGDGCNFGTLKSRQGMMRVLKEFSEKRDGYNYIGPYKINEECRHNAMIPTISKALRHTLGT
jgi:hypothetical protein